LTGRNLACEAPTKDSSNLTHATLSSEKLFDDLKSA
jgi:hypothetical protein